MKRFEWAKLTDCSKQKTRNQPSITRKFTYTESERTSNFKNIQSDVSAVLIAFEKEREKQIRTVDKMKQQLKSINSSAESLIKSTTKGENQYYPSTPIVNTIRPKTKELNNLAAENETLKEELRLLHSKQHNELNEIKSKLLHLVGGDKERYADKNIDELLKVLEEVIVNLIEERNKMEQKYFSTYQNPIKALYKENTYDDSKEHKLSICKNYLSKSKEDINFESVLKGEYQYNRTEIPAPRNEPNSLKQRIIKLDNNLKAIENKDHCNPTLQHLDKYERRLNRLMSYSNKKNCIDKITLHHKH